MLLTRVRAGATTITTLSTHVHFGGSRDITVEGLHVELVYPADAASEAFLAALGRGDGQPPELPRHLPAVTRP